VCVWPTRIRTIFAEHLTKKTIEAMGCSGSKATPAAAPAAAPAPAILTTPAPEQALQTASKAKGAGKGRGKQGKGKPVKAGKFQITLSGDWKDYEPEEDAILKKAFLVGQPNCKFSLRGQDYEYNFQTMKQRNLGTDKSRDIRPPMGMTQPQRPLLPTGPMVVVTVPKNSAGKTIEIDDPNNRGRKIEVNVPPGAKAGQKMAVPVPAAGESVGSVQEKQRRHGAGAKLALGVAGVAAVGGLAVGGVVLGDHLTGGGLGAADAAADAAEAVADWTTGAAEDVAEWTTGAAEDVADWAGPAFEDAGEWIEGAAEDAGEWIEGAAEDVVDWFEGAGEDVADFVTTLF